MHRLSSLLIILLLVGCTKAQIDTSKLKAPPGFRVSIFADTKQDARLMAFSPGGVLLLTAPSDGNVLALPDADKDGKADRVATVVGDLNGPHGIAFHQGKLYVAEVGQVVRYDWDEKQLRATNPAKIADLPTSGGGHMTRTLLFAGGKLYVAAGSSCNVCVEEDERRAAVMEMNPDGSARRIFARGLRNAVGLAWNPATQTVWATDNGTDWLGDDLPPEEVNDLGKNGGDFGWPYCYGKRVPDTKFSAKSRQHCPSTIPARVEMQAHSAPLNLIFYDGAMFPAEYRGDLFVTFHGSWNRSVPTGYKVVRIRLNEKSEPEGIEDFISGWFPQGAGKGKWLGRPVGLAIGSDGALYVSDDANGAIYRVAYSK